MYLEEKLCIDPVAADKKKIRLNEKKYSVSLVRGSSKKCFKSQDSAGLIESAVSTLIRLGLHF